MPVNAGAETQATRELYVDEILSRQLGDGGFALSGTSADPDITAMALQALAKYTDRADVAEAVEEALSCLSALQNSAGGYASWGTANSESVAQVIVALGELGISLDDSRFVKNGNTLVDNLLSYAVAGGGFRHTPDGTVNQMATEQAFYALVSARRNENGKNSLYRMSDARSVSDPDHPDLEPGEGLEGKNPDVTACPIVHAGVSFSDLPEENPMKTRRPSWRWRRGRSSTAIRTAPSVRKIRCRGPNMPQSS
jgi:hypothetical protein